MKIKPVALGVGVIVGAVGCEGSDVRTPTTITTRAASSAPAVSWISTEFLGRPTDQSVTVKAIARQSLDAYVEYGTTAGNYTGGTSPASFSDGSVEVTVGGLAPDARYHYRLRFRPTGSSSAFAAGGDHTFHTQRARGSAFTFAVQADSHQGVPVFYDDALYRTTMQNILAEENDFLLDLGDTFSLDDAGETAATVAQKYVNQLAVFDLAAHSVPVFLVLGNHERETGWNLDDFGADVGSSLPVLNANARKRYFLNPEPDDFYSGDTDVSGGSSFVSGDHLRGDYYAFEWGDALFVAIEPFWYTMRKPYPGTIGWDKDDEVVGTRWDWSLGQRQYLWLQQTLQASGATYKFVFAHHVAGGIDDYGRGGARGARYCEWGGYDIDGTTWGFATHRPGWAMPVHQLLAQNHVSIFFHAHDHVFAKETLDGVVYQEVPMAANANCGTGFPTNGADYAGAQLIPNSGHLRVTVAPANVTVDYVRSFLPGAGTNGSIATSYTIRGGRLPAARTVR
ncbi:MAG TPA: metallophosphoesterase [Polyangia bacterium]|nr:metallophosphoesterase [Polyangia bacterium]